MKTPAPALPIRTAMCISCLNYQTWLKEIMEVLNRRGVHTDQDRLHKSVIAAVGADLEAILSHMKEEL